MRNPILVLVACLAGCTSPTEPPPETAPPADEVGLGALDGDSESDTLTCSPPTEPLPLSEGPARPEDAPVALVNLPEAGVLVLWGAKPDAELRSRRQDECGVVAPERTPALTLQPLNNTLRGFDLDRSAGALVTAATELQWSCNHACSDGRCAAGELWSWHRHTVSWWSNDLAGEPLGRVVFETDQANGLYSTDASGCVDEPFPHSHLTSRATARVVATSQNGALLLWDETASQGSTPGVVQGRLFEPLGATSTDLGPIGAAWTYFDVDGLAQGGFVVAFRDGEGVGVMRLDSSGAPVGPVVYVFDSNYTDHGRVRVAGLPGSTDRAALAFGAGLPGERDVYALALQGSTPIGVPVRVHDSPEFEQYRPAVAGYEDGSFDVFWEEAEWPRVMRRRFGPDGVMGAAAEVLAEPGSNPTACSDGLALRSAWIGAKGRVEVSPTLHSKEVGAAQGADR